MRSVTTGLAGLVVGAVLLCAPIWAPSAEEGFRVPRPAPRASAEQTHVSPQPKARQAAIVTASVDPSRAQSQVSARSSRAARPIPVSAMHAVPPMPARKFDRGRAPAAAERVEPRLKSWVATKGLEWGAPVYIRIFKESRELELWMEGEDERFALFQTYPICAVSGTLGPKERVGDEQAPEGFYMVTPNLLNPYSQYHLAMNLGYPNSHDRRLGRSGGLIMIHGDCQSRGCFAMTDRLIEDIYILVQAALKNGQRGVPVHVFPFRMTEENLRRHSASPWRSFWRGLKPAADHFDEHGRPPSVMLDTATRRYLFQPG